MHKEEIINGAIDAGGDVAGALVGAGVGGAVAGPFGAVGGAVLSSVTATVFKKVGDEIQARLLSKGESKRVGEAFELAIAHIEKRIKDGDCIRDDGFFNDGLDDRSPAEEILEGTLLVAQREYEEKKIPYLSKLYANISFDQSVTRPMANRLLKIAEDLTYRQIVILKVIGFLQIQSALIDTRVKHMFGSISGVNEVGIVSDIFDLYKSSLIFSSEAALDATGINPSALKLGGYGALIYQLMELDTMDLEYDAHDVMQLLVENFNGNGNQ